MKLQVKITWANAGHALLPEALAQITLSADGATLTAKVSKQGERQFEIPDGTTNVTLKAQFSVAFGTVALFPAKDGTPRNAAPTQEVVWRAEQPFTVRDGTELVPTDLPAYVKGHPLVETHAVSGIKGAVLLRLRTEFVNITPFWMAYGDGATDYLAGRSGAAELVVLGCTGNTPLIWLASIPDACKSPPSPGVSCLVFFRPDTQYVYTRVDQAHRSWRANRYLLSPKNSATAPDERDYFTPPDPAKNFKGYVWLRCGFEDALQRSGKAVVLLQPWPSGSSFGGATSSYLAGLCESAIRFLWAEQYVAKTRGGIHLGRLGLAGYSAGGVGLWPALRANADRVSEVYSFDPVGTKAAAPQVIQWFKQKPTTRCLRMTNAHQMATHLAIEVAIGKSARVSAEPPSPRSYDAGANPLWDHVVSLTPDYRTKAVYWHQFAGFGGYPALPGPYALTFLQRFLQDSDF